MASGVGNMRKNCRLSGAGEAREEGSVEEEGARQNIRNSLEKGRRRRGESWKRRFREGRKVMSEDQKSYRRLTQCEPFRFIQTEVI